MTSNPLAPRAASVPTVAVLVPGAPSASIELLVDAVQHSSQLRLVVLGRSGKVPPSSARLTGGERFFRWLDRAFFGHPASAIHAVPLPELPLAGNASTPEPDLWLDLCAGSAMNRVRTEVPTTGIGLSVSFDGQPAVSLIEAVRAKLGRKGETVHAVVWVDANGARTSLFEGECCLDHRSLSRSAGWVAAKLASLLAGAWRRLKLGSAIAVRPATGDAHPHSAAALTARLLSTAWRRLLWRDQWVIQVHRPARDDAMKPGELASVLEPPRGAFWADPFVVARGGSCWVFFEALSFASGRGQICVVELDAAGRPTGDAQVALAEPWHLSYPFLWQEGEALYMIPESSANRSVDLYLCEHFPRRWRKAATLIDGARLADATLVKHSGRYWLFAAHGDSGACMYDELHVYWADRLMGPWRPHEANPVKIDARSARPAGAMWSHDGRLFRPVQDCSRIYGGAVSVQEVTALDPETFSECQAGSIQVAGKRCADAMHTFNSSDGATVVDRMRRQWRWDFRFGPPGGSFEKSIYRNEP